MEERGFLEVPGGRLYYEADGDGPPLVLVHAGVANLRQWDPHVPAWSAHYRVVRYDTRGFGQSETEHVEFTNRDDVEAVLDFIGTEKAHLVGHSRSGSIVTDFAVTHPDRVRSLTVVAGGLGGYKADVSDEAAATGEAMEKASEASYEAKDWRRLADLEADYWVDGPGQPAGRADPAVRASVYEWVYTTYAAEKDEGIPQRLDPPAATRLDQITFPLLVVIGALDEAHTNASMRHLASQVPGSQLEVLEGSGHMLTLEQPKRFTQLVLDFLAGVDAGR
ncbi:MAG: alpha/beta hydrolase [Chloroflexota bacterium]